MVIVHHFIIEQNRSEFKLTIYSIHLPTHMNFPKYSKEFGFHKKNSDTENPENQQKHN